MDEENEPESEGSESVVDESVSEEKGKEDDLPKVEDKIEVVSKEEVKVDVLP